MKINLILYLALAALTAGACSSPDRENTGEAVKSDSLNARTEYTCPMHPSVVSDRPGTCQDCKMELQVKS
jgi:hypothetical protein